MCGNVDSGETLESAIIIATANSLAEQLNSEGFEGWVRIRPQVMADRRSSHKLWIPLFLRRYRERLDRTIRYADSCA